MLGGTGENSLRQASGQVLSPDHCRQPSRIIPVAGGEFLAYSCAAARDFHPLPSPLYEDARTEEDEKEQNE